MLQLKHKPKKIEGKKVMTNMEAVECAALKLVTFNLDDISAETGLTKPAVIGCLRMLGNSEALFIHRSEENLGRKVTTTYTVRKSQASQKELWRLAIFGVPAPRSYA